MSQAEVAVMTIIMVPFAWALVTLMLASRGEDNEGSFLYPGKRDGERGIVTVCRWTFLFVFSPAIISLVVALGLVEAAPDRLKRLWTWLLEKG